MHAASCHTCVPSVLTGLYMYNVTSYLQSLQAGEDVYPRGMFPQAMYPQAVSPQAVYPQAGEYILILNYLQHSLIQRQQLWVMIEMCVKNYGRMRL